LQHVLCLLYILEPHPQTSTGTIALQVEDLNDNCPKLLGNVQTVCSDTKVVNVTAEDSDSYPNGAPLKFNLIQEKTKGKWNLLTINGKTKQNYQLICFSIIILSNIFRYSCK